MRPNPSRRGGKPETNPLSYGTAMALVYKRLLIQNITALNKIAICIVMDWKFLFTASFRLTVIETEEGCIMGKEQLK
jgi:hypothetical protein